jgi:hypothetical protein
MSEFEAQTFLGCTIRNFNCNTGWGRDPTTVTVSLVEDKKRQEEFTNPLLHSLAYFNFISWDYHGILTNIDENISESGNRLFEVVLTDPRQFLEGVTLILDGYAGPVHNVPNLFNIYGYLESVEYGYSQRTSAGIPWGKIAEGVNRLMLNGSIVNRNNVYNLDLSGLPVIDPTYRISDPEMSLLDLIEETCEVANHDYIIELQNVNTISIVTINRNQPYVPGSIKRYLSTKSGYSSASSSLQAEFNTMNKFIVGPPVDEMRYQYYNDGNDPELTEADNTISNYWGLDRFGNVILPNNRADWNGEYSVTVEGFEITNDAYLMDIQPGQTLAGPTFDTKYQDFSNGYTFTISELRAALISREAWENFIILNDYVVPDPDTQTRSLHEGKKAKIGIEGEVDNGFSLEVVFGNRDLANINPAEISAFKSAIARTTYEDDDYVQRVYDFVKNYAEYYYGRKYMVRTMFVEAKVNEFNQIETSYEPTESGYIDETLLDEAARLNLVPYDLSIIQTPENKLTAYVRYDVGELIVASNGDVYPANDARLNISTLPKDSYYLGNSRFIDDSGERDDRINEVLELRSLFVKVNVEPDIVFLNKATAFSPRVVIELPGPVSTFGGDSGGHPHFILRDLLAKRGLPQDEIDRQVSAFMGKVGSDNSVYGGGPLHVFPLFAAVPLRNNKLNYGPWYTNNGNGKVEFIKKDELAPWNFGGFANMNAAANLLVSNMSEARFLGEAGSIEFAGLPDIQPGRPISASGPIINNISVSFGEGGVVTRYTLGRWDMKYGRNNQKMFDRIKQSNDAAKKIRSIARNQVANDKRRVKANTVSLAWDWYIPRRWQSNSSSQMVLSSTDSYSGFYQTNSATMPIYTALGSLVDEGWTNKGGMSLDGMYRAFSTDPNYSGTLPKYESYSGGNTNQPTINDLDPFGPGSDIQTIFYGSGVPEELSRESYTATGDEDFRPIALRGPLVVAGYGYDTEGNPVPGSNQAFIDDYKTRSDQWKVGPVDLRWDNERKLWAANPGGKTLAKLRTGTLPARNGDVLGSGLCALCRIDDGVIERVGDYNVVVLNATISDVTADYILVNQVGGDYVYAEGGRELREVVTDTRIQNNNIEAKYEQHWVYPYSGVAEWRTIIEGSGC